jgi:dihydroorotate dehydrogenase (fumarate)
MPTDLRARYLGLDLAHPLVASASPLTGNLDTLLALQDAGVAAVVMPSLFEEQIEHDSYNAGAAHYVELLRRAKNELRVPVIASLNGTTVGGWTRYAGLLADAGADALELNVYLVAADVTMSSMSVEAQYVRLVEAVRATIDIPLAVKIGPYFSSVGAIARRLVDAGADGLVLFNRFYLPDVDLDELRVVPDVTLSMPGAIRLPLRWIAILYKRVDAYLAASSGVHDATDAVKLVLAGADVVMMTSALLKHGPAHVATVLAGVEQWFGDRGYASLIQARGSLSQLASPDPLAFERSNYMRALASYSSTR